MPPVALIANNETNPYIIPAKILLSLSIISSAQFFCTSKSPYTTAQQNFILSRISFTVTMKLSDTQRDHHIISLPLCVTKHRRTTIPESVDRLDLIPSRCPCGHVLRVRESVPGIIASSPITTLSAKQFEFAVRGPTVTIKRYNRPIVVAAGQNLRGARSDASVCRNGALALRLCPCTGPFVRYLRILN